MRTTSVAFSLHPNKHTSDCHRLLLSLVDWVRQYEAWVVENEGVDYRRATLKKWNQVVPAEGMVSAWETLRLAIENASSHFLMNVSDE